MAIHEGKFHLDHVKRLNHMDPAGFNFAAAITCILPMPLVLFTGDEDGRVVSHLLSFPRKRFLGRLLLTWSFSMSGIVYNDNDGAGYGE